MRRSSVVAVAALTMLGLVVTGPAQAKVSGPNGQIAFARADPATGEDYTYAANPDGTHVEPLLPFGSQAPHWSPDGSRVAVAACADPPVCDTASVIVDPDTGTYRVLTMPDPALFTGCLVWSPDAQRLACEGQGQTDPNRSGIYTIRSSDGGGLTRITSNPSGDDNPIDYSPSGSQIVFDRMDPSRVGKPNQALFVVNLDGTGLRRITPWGFSDDDGSWSPDGTQIAFEHRGSLFVVHPNGSDLARISLATDGWSFEGDFSWSPDGTKIVFLIGIATGPHAIQEGIATANADGSDVRQVTNSPTFDHQADWGSHPPTT
jgi:Tol biopolymer transport system component